MDRYPSVFGSEREAMADVLREIVRKRDNDVTDFQELTDAFNIINTTAIQAIAALTPSANMVPYFDGSSTAALMPVSKFARYKLEHEIIWFNDFANTTSELGFAINNIASGTTSDGDGETNHPGIVTIISSATVNSGGNARLRNASFRLAGSEKYNCIFKLETMTNATYRMGLCDASTSADAVDGVYFEINSAGAAIGKTADNSTRSSTATIATLSTATWYHCRITMNSSATLATYEIFNDSGTSLGSSTLSTNIPTGAAMLVGSVVTATESAGATQNLISVDYIDTSINRPILRGAFQ